jgi:hypothetical protein
MLTQTQARIAFLSWLQQNHPALASAAIDYADSPNNNMSGLGEESWWQKLAAGATALGTTYLALKNQRDTMKLNIARAEQGLPPLDVAATAPVIRTQVEIDPALARKIGGGIGAGLNTTMLMVGAGILLVVLLMGRKK